MNIGENLKKIREKKGYSQEMTANSLGVSYGTYHKIEKGKADIKFSLLEKFAEIMEIPLLELIPKHHIEYFYKRSLELSAQLDDIKSFLSLFRRQEQ